MSSMFAAQREKYGTASPDTGLGGLGAWPSEGDHHCYITGILVDEDAKFFESNDSGMRTEHPAISIRFQYTLFEDLDNPEDPLEWGGAPFVFPMDLTPIHASGKLKQIEIARNRLCGHLTTILGEKVGTDDGLDEDDALDKVKALVEGDTHIIADVRCQYKKGKGENAATYKTEFLMSLISD